jgi:hypothetical protein
MTNVILLYSYCHLNVGLGLGWGSVVFWCLIFLSPLTVTWCHASCIWKQIPSENDSSQFTKKFGVFKNQQREESHIETKETSVPSVGLFLIFTWLAWLVISLR